MVKHTKNNNLPVMKDAVLARSAIEHINIIALFREALSHGIRTQQGSSKFKEAKFALLNHHESELALVYWPIQEARKARVAQYKSGSDEITMGFIHTIEMLLACEASLYAGDITSEQKLLELINTVSARIDFEEEVVLLMYRELKNNP